MSNLSKMRPEVKDARPGSYAPSYADSIYMIRDAVKQQPGLIHGKLYAKGMSCAIGSFWDVNPKLALKTTTIDEVAAYNDSIPPNVTPRVRRNRVLAWLNWKVKVLGGDTSAKKPA